MAASDPVPPVPVVRVSATEMAGDWVAEVEKKLIDQGFDRQVAAQIARIAQEEVQQLAPKGKPSRPSWWRRALSFLDRTNRRQ